MDLQRNFGSLLLLFAAHCTFAAVPQRVTSLNLCSDQLLLELLPPDHIASVTYMSRESYQSYRTAEARRVGVNHGQAEQIVAERPDLVIAGLYTTPQTRFLLKSVGIPLLELPPANNFQEIRDITRRVAHAVGADEQAERLIRQMDDTLARLAATKPSRPITIIGWDGGGYVPGKDTLFDAIVSAAGAVNVGAAPGLRSGGVDTERLLMLHPDLLAFGDATLAAPALHTAPLFNPAVRRMYRGRAIRYPELLYSCGLPESAQAALQIRRVMLQVLGSKTPA